MSEFKNWGELHSAYNMVNITNLTDKEAIKEDFINEGLENGIYDYIDEEAEEIDEDGEEVECEPYQYFAIGIFNSTANRLNIEYNLNIYYSEVLGLWILPVYHYGTAWYNVGLGSNKSITSEKQEHNAKLIEEIKGSK